MTIAQIKKLFTEEQLEEFRPTGRDALRGPCPSCGKPDAFMINSTNTYCYSSQSSMNFYQTAGILAGLFGCTDLPDRRDIKGRLKEDIEQWIEDQCQMPVYSWWSDDKQPRFLPANAARDFVEHYKIITVGQPLGVRNPMYWYKDGVYRDDCRVIVGQDLEIYAKGIRTNTHQEVICSIQRLSTMPVEEFFHVDKPELLCVGNGNLNVLTGELTEHTPEIIQTCKLPWNWNPKAKCPEFKKFLNSILRPEQQKLLQEYIGSCLIRDYRFKKALIFVGPSGTGKTTVMNILLSFFTKSNQSSLPLQGLRDRFGINDLFGKMVNAADELSAEDLQSTGTFKSCTGNSTIRAELKHSISYTFIPYAKHLYACNRIPSVRIGSDDDAYYGRWLIMFFNNVIPNPVLALEKTFENNVSEMEGLLKWAYDGLHRLVKNGRFTYPHSIEDNRDFMTGNNSIRSFVKHCIKDGSDEIPKRELYECYGLFVSLSGGTLEAVNKFGAEFPKVHPSIQDKQKAMQKDGTAPRVWVGLDVKYLKTSINALKESLTSATQVTQLSKHYIYNNIFSILSNKSYVTPVIRHDKAHPKGKRYFGKKRKKVQKDRDIQYFEHPETADIKQKCTKSEVLKYVKTCKKKETASTIYKKLGDGSTKHLNQLVKEGKISKVKGKYGVAKK